MKDGLRGLWFLIKSFVSVIIIGAVIIALFKVVIYILYKL